MPKEMKLLLGGADRTLKFGTMGFFKYVGEVFEGDPLEMMNGVSNPKKQYEIIYACIYAGLKCAANECKKEEVDTWVQELDFDSAAAVIKTVQEAMIGGNGKAGEQEARELVNQSAGAS